MTPIKTNESNFCYLGPNDAIADLPCRVQGNDTYSVWELTEAERRMIADGAHIRLGVYGARPIPPMSIEIVPDIGAYERVPSPCTVCGEEPEHEVHRSGPGTHAYRSRATKGAQQS